MSKKAGPDIFRFRFLLPFLFSRSVSLLNRSSVSRSGNCLDPSLRRRWRGSCAARTRQEGKEPEALLKKAKRRKQELFFFLQRKPRAKQLFFKVSFGAHAHRRPCAPARPRLRRSSSPRVAGLTGPSSRAKKRAVERRQGAGGRLPRENSFASLRPPCKEGKKGTKFFPLQMEALPRLCSALPPLSLRS